LTGHFLPGGLELNKHESQLGMRVYQ
jgi:hypothetical protein